MTQGVDILGGNLVEESIELIELIEILIKRKLLIALTTVAFLIFGAIYNFVLITPVYQANTTLMVNGSKGISASDIVSNFDLGSINMSQKLVVTYGEIVKSRIVLEQTIDKLGLDESYEELLSKITSAPVGSTEILKISVNDEDATRAAEIANTISDVFVKEVMRILKVNNVETIDRAIPINRPININTTLSLTISLFLGLMISAFVAFLLEYLDNTLKTSQDVEKHLGLVMIGTIPDFEQIKKN